METLNFCILEIFDQPKIKKKRQQIKKQITNDSNEYELMLDRIQSQLDVVQFSKRSLDQYSELDRNILFYPSMTNLPDRPGILNLLYLAFNVLYFLQEKI